MPRGLRGDPSAAAVRGAASAPLLAHAPAQCLGCRSPPAPIAAQVAGVRAAGDGGALPRAVARRAGGVRRHVLVPRAHQAQRLAVGVDAIHLVTHA